MLSLNLRNIERGEERITLPSMPGKFQNAGMQIATLAFLNLSHCFDDVHNAGCFIGHESLFKVRFWLSLAR